MHSISGPVFFLLRGGRDFLFGARRNARVVLPVWGPLLTLQRPDVQATLSFLQAKNALVLRLCFRVLMLASQSDD